MAATESWAGGKITGDIGWGGQPPRGGYVPLADIPNVPKTVDMPMLDYPKMPSIRYDVVPGKVDMESRAQKLMQKELPSSFEEAGNIRTAAAGKGQMAMGKAIAGVGADIGQAMGYAGRVLGQVMHKAREASIDRDTETFNHVSEAYKNDISLAINTLPPNEQAEAIKKATEKYDKARAGLGSMDQVARDKIESSGNSVRDTQLNYVVPLKQNMRVINETNQMWETKLKDSRDKGDWAGADQAIDGLKKTGAYSDDMAKVEQEKNKDLQGQEHVRVAMALNPKPVMDEAKNVMEGGTSKDFPWLNKHNAPTVFTAAREESNRKDAETLTDLSTRIANGQLSDPDEIKRLAEARNLGPEDVLKLNKSLADYHKNADVNMSLDPAKLVDARQRVAKYEATDDPTLEKYKDTLNFINANIPPAERAKLIGALNDKSMDALKQKSPEQIARDREKDSTHDEVATLGKQGLFLEDSAERELFRKAAAKIKKGEKDLTQEELAAWRKGNSLTDAHLNTIDAMATKEPDFAPGELHKKAFEKLSPEIQKSVTSYTGGAPAPRAQVNTSILIPTREQLQAAGALPPADWVATGPRDVNKATPSFYKAVTGPGQSFEDVRFTAYTPGKGNIRMEGANAVAARGGPAFTFEGYQRGTFPWVSAAVDPGSKLAGKFFISEAHPNVVMKGEDTGSAFQGAGESHIDVAFEDPQKAGNYEITGGVKVIDNATAMEISGAQKRGTASSGYAGTSVNPELLAKVSTLEQTFGKLSVVSGYRSAETNKKAGGASGSQHLHGNAVDLATGHMSNEKKVQLILAAKAQGITGIGVYANNLHFDLGPRRAWGPSYHAESIPAWARPYLQDYINA